MKQRIEKQQRKSTKPKVGSLKRSAKLKKNRSAVLMKKKRGKNQISKIRNARGFISIDFTEIKEV